MYNVLDSLAVLVPITIITQVHTWILPHLAPWVQTVKDHGLFLAVAAGRLMLVLS